MSEAGEYLQIPTLDSVSIDILSVLQHDDFRLPVLAAILEREPIIAKQIIKLAACPLYGASQKMDSVEKAVAFLGIKTALTIGLGLSIFQRLLREEGKQRELWTWSRLVLHAVAARELARLTKQAPSDQAFLLGMLQDVGLVILVDQQPGDYAPVLSKFRIDLQPLADIELDRVGVTHALISQAMLEYWQFPQPQCNAIGAHHHHVAVETLSPLTAILHAAEHLTDFLLCPSPATYRPMVDDLNRIYSGNRESQLTLLEHAADHGRSLASILNIQLPKPLNPRSHFERIATKC